MKGLRRKMMALGGVLENLPRKGISVELTFEQRQRNKTSQRKCTLGRMNSRCKGPGVRISLMYSRKRKESNVSRVEGTR